jgi:Transmembrane domain of unknown function (DUF3566)
MAVRRVRRVLRKIDPWTVLKVSLIFNAIAGLIFVLGVWVLWSLAIQRGIPEQITDFFSNFALVFTPEGELYFRVVVLLAVIWVVSFTGVLTLGAVLYNLISDVVGGVEYIVLEETYAMVAATTRQAPIRPAVHVPASDDVDTVQDDTLAAAGAAEYVEEYLDATGDDEAVEIEVEVEAVVDEEVTVEDDDLPVRAVSET